MMFNTSPFACRAPKASRPYNGITPVSAGKEGNQSNKHVGVSKNRGTPKWMVKIMETPIKMDDLGGKPTIFGNIHVLVKHYHNFQQGELH